jgi:hypothetical protein
MREENLKAIEALREKIRAREEEVRQLKIVVNGFYADEGEPVPYSVTKADASTNLGALRSDLFYGNTLAEAAQVFLEMRKANGLGSASVNEIYAALKTGGYKFDTKNEEYAKNGLRISLRKNNTIFHQLPAGDYGLCSWYNIKGGPKEDTASRKKKGAKRKRSGKLVGKASNGEHPAPEKTAAAENLPPPSEPLATQPRGRKQRPKKVETNLTGTATK